MNSCFIHCDPLPYLGPYSLSKNVLSIWQSTEDDTGPRWTSHRAWPEGAKGPQGGSSHRNSRWLLLSQYQGPEPTYIRRQMCRRAQKRQMVRVDPTPYPYLSPTIPSPLLRLIPIPTPSGVFSGFSSHRNCSPIRIIQPFWSIPVTSKLSHKTFCISVAKIPPRLPASLVRCWSKCEPGSTTIMPKFKYSCSSKWPHRLTV